MYIYIYIYIYIYVCVYIYIYAWCYYGASIYTTASMSIASAVLKTWAALQRVVNTRWES